MKKQIIKLAIIISLTNVMLFAQENFKSGIHKIKKYYAEGKIDKKSMIKNMIYFVFDKKLLKQDFYYENERPIKSATGIINEFYKNKNLFTEEEIKNLEKYWIIDLKEYEDTKNYTKEGPIFSFCYNYYTSGPHAISTLDANSNGIPDYIEQIDSYLENVKLQLSYLGYEYPDVQSNVYKVYIRDLGGSIYGYTAREQNAPDYTYIVLDNDYHGYPQNDDPEGSSFGTAKVTCAHEYKHAVQEAYSDWNEPMYFLELDATWTEDLIYDYVDDYVNFLDPGYNNTPLYHHNMSFGERDGYSECLWMHYLTER